MTGFRIFSLLRKRITLRFGYTIYTHGQTLPSPARGEWTARRGGLAMSRVKSPKASKSKAPKPPPYGTKYLPCLGLNCRVSFWTTAGRRMCRKCSDRIRNTVMTRIDILGPVATHGEDK